MTCIIEPVTLCCVTLTDARAVMHGRGGTGHLRIVGPESHGEHLPPVAENWIFPDNLN
jgi:hypothetical protein